MKKQSTMKMVGEVVKFNDEWYQCVNGDKCENCDLKEHCIKSEPMSTCGKDNYVIFKKLNKVEENLELHEGLLCDKYPLTYHGIMDPIYNGNEALFFTGSFMYVISKTQKEMEVKKVKINHEDANYLLDVLERILHDNRCMEYKDEIIDSFSKYFDCKPEYVSFNLEKALNGANVVTRSGKKARIVCSDAAGKFPIIALVMDDDGSEIPYRYCLNGNYNLAGSESQLDLMMVQSKRSGWINIHRTGNSDFAAIASPAYLFKTEEEAKSQINYDTILTTAKIEWNE